MSDENTEIVINGFGEQSYTALSVIYEEEGSSGVSVLKISDSPGTSASKLIISMPINISFALHLMFVPIFVFLALILLHSLFCFAYSSIENNSRELGCWTRYGNLMRLSVMAMSASLASAGFDLWHDQIMAFCGISCRIVHYGYFVQENIDRKKSAFALFLHFAFCVILAFIGVMYIGIEHRLMKNGFCDGGSFTLPTGRLFIDLFTIGVFSIRALP
uniref:Uncharacterized protein n=1 Tax=Romanomermis culicivorax TaxID=13658 RepID=A0A915I8X8_ROMCU